MAPRNSRGGSKPAPAKTSRGGIKKRSRGADRDGDVSMDAGGGSGVSKRRPEKSSTSTSQAPRRGATSGRGPSAGRGGAPRVNDRMTRAVNRHLNGEGVDMVKKRKEVSLVWLSVVGLAQSKAASNSDGGMRDLLSFLERKSTSLTQKSPPVVVKQSRQKGDTVLIAATKEDAEELIKVNGFSFAGAKLDVTDHEGSLEAARKSRAESEDIKAKLTEILSARYDVATKLLKLDALNQDQALVTMGMLESKDRAEKLIKVMMKICDDLFKTAKDKLENIHSVSLANNGIDSINQVEVVAETFPDLLNLDLSGNALATTASLSRWKGKLRKLETLYITNNPLDVSDAKVRADLVKFFPKLRDINGEQLTPQHKEQLLSFTKPRPIPQHGPDFRDTNKLGEGFLFDIFVGFDNDRHALLAKYYDDESQFSLNVDTNSIRDPDAPQPMPWATYIPKSRNFTRITTEGARSSRLLTGREAILENWKELPATKHPDIGQETTKYIMDCHLLPGLADPNGQAPTSDGMIISVHGQFEEIDPHTKKQGLRSFSRSFVLGPGKPGNHHIRVISDMLSLRAYNPLPNVFEAPAAPAAPTPVVPVAAPAADEEQLRQAKIAELCKQTNMTPHYSQMCLSDYAWDFDRAIAVFNEKKSILPPEAFAG